MRYIPHVLYMGMIHPYMQYTTYELNVLLLGPMSTIKDQFLLHSTFSSHVHHLVTIFLPSHTAMILSISCLGSSKTQPRNLVLVSDLLLNRMFCCCWPCASMHHYVTTIFLGCHVAMMVFLPALNSAELSSRDESFTCEM